MILTNVVNIYILQMFIKKNYVFVSFIFLNEYKKKNEEPCIKLFEAKRFLLTY